MNTIPLELVYSVLEHLPSRTDLANFRLVQRCFADLGASFLFRDIPVEPAKSSLSRLFSIFSPALLRHVKEIHFLYKNTELMVWPEYDQEMRLQRSMNDREAKALLKSFILAADTFLNSGELTTSFETIFRTFSSLEAVVISPFSRLEYPSATEYGEKDWYYVLYEPLDPEKFAQVFAKLIDAAYVTNVSLASFKVTHPLRPSHYFYPNHETLCRAATVFRSCEVIEMCVALFEGSDTGGPLPKDPLFPALAPAEKLRELKISDCNKIYMGYPSWRELSKPLYPQIFGSDHVWPNLVRVSFPGCNIYDHEIIGFLSRHKKTLREVSTGHARLKAGLWIDVMKFMRENMKLTILELPSEGLVDSDGCVNTSEAVAMMVEYVLNGGKMPVQAKYWRN